MARFIHCQPCSVRLRQPQSTCRQERHYLEPPQIEIERYVWGVLIIDCRCDQCRCDLDAGTRALAYTVETPDNPIRDWEGEYLTHDRQYDPPPTP